MEIGIFVFYQALFTSHGSGYLKLKETNKENVFLTVLTIQNNLTKILSTVVNSHSDLKTFGNLLSV